MTGAGTSLRRQLLTAASATLILNASSRILTLVITVVLARWLGASSYGVFATAMSVLLVLSIVSNLGFPLLTTRLLATYREREQWSLMRGLIGRSNALVITVSVAVAVVGAGVLWLIRDRIPASHLQTFWWAMATLPLASIVALHAANLRGLHRTVLSLVPEHLVLPSLFLLLVLAWGWIASDARQPPSADFAVSLRFLATAVAVAVGALSLLFSIPSRVRETRPQFESEQWRQSATPLLVLSLMAIITTQTDILMLAAIRGSESAGVYQAAARGAGVVSFSLLVVATAAQSTIAQLHAAGNREKLQRLVTVTTRVALALALPVAVVLIVFAEPVLRIAFGVDFERGSSALMILCVAQVFSVSVGFVGLILNMTGFERDASFGMAIGAAANILLNAFLIPVWDIQGAAIATGLSILVSNALLVVLVRKRTGLKTTPLG